MHGNLGDALRRRAWVSPKTEAVVDLASGQRMTYPELNARVNQVAHGMTSLGIMAGDRIALLCFNGVEFVESYFAAAKIGAVIVPLNWRLTASELGFILQNSASKALIFGSEFTEVVAQIRQNKDDVPDLEHFIEIADDGGADWSRPYLTLLNHDQTSEPDIAADGDDPLTIVYTSGTTGLPKGVVHSHHTAMSALMNALATFEFNKDERYLVALPLFHVGASTPLLLHLFRGSTVILMRQFDPTAIWDTFEQERVTATLAVPAMLNFMLKVPGFEDRDRTNLAGIITGASPVPVELINAYANLGIEIHQVYGMTETFGPGCYLKGAEAAERSGSTGKGYMMTDVRIIDGNGQDVPPGTPGQILLRGDHNMVEYWNNPKATAETMVDGWLHTGDIGIADDDGYVTVHDRLKDMIISGGENVYPAELENIMLAHPDVADVAVIGQPSDTWGESPFAIVVPASDQASQSSIMQHCQTNLAGFKQPKGMAFLDEIPRNPTGKPLKRVLREQFPGPAIE